MDTAKAWDFERTNKLELLLAKLTNPLLPYLERADRIEVYEQIPGLKKDMHPRLISLYNDDFTLYSWAEKSFVVNDFLKKYYHYLKLGQVPAPADRSKNARRKEYFEELNHAKYSFKTHEELQAFCRSKLPTYGRECMVIWYKKHAMFQPELFDPAQSTQFPQPAEPNSTPMPTEVNTSLQGLISKFNAR